MSLAKIGFTLFNIIDLIFNLIMKVVKYMKNRVLKVFMTLAAVIFTTMATVVSASACCFSAYQPKEPKCLKNN